MRLLITVEGQTEEGFVKHVLAPYLSGYNIGATSRSVLTRRDKRSNLEYRGGWRRTDAYHVVRDDIRRWIKEDHDPHARFTTMFDLYALPSDFPKYAQAMASEDPYICVETLEKALAEDLNTGCYPQRFIPYIQLHEFESLLLSDPQKFECEFLEHEQAIRKLVEMVSREGGNPELIDNGYETAPSKRIIAEIPEYKDLKRTAGPLVAAEIGMKKMREKCLHFAEWIDLLTQTAGAM